MTQPPTKAQHLLARATVILMVAFVASGAIWYGFSTHEFQRVWRNLLDRPSGPMVFRIILQPTMGAIAALRDGIKDAKTGRSPYLWTILANPAKRSERLHEGLISTARIMLLAIGVDFIYQFIALKAFYPGEAVIVALILAFVPYLLLRGPVARITRSWRGPAVAR